VRGRADRIRAAAYRVPVSANRRSPAITEAMLTDLAQIAEQ
jgi:hypothetical protein